MPFAVVVMATGKFSRSGGNYEHWGEFPERTARPKPNDELAIFMEIHLDRRPTDKKIVIRLSTHQMCNVDHYEISFKLDPSTSFSSRGEKENNQVAIYFILFFLCIFTVWTPRQYNFTMASYKLVNRPNGRFYSCKTWALVEIMAKTCTRV